MSNFTADQKALLAFIEARNAETVIWVDAKKGRWATTMVADLTHWAESDVYSIADYKRYMLIQDVWDMGKEVTGIRPRWLDVQNMTNEELQTELDYFCNQSQEQDEQADHDAEISMMYETEDAAEQQAEIDDHVSSTLNGIGLSEEDAYFLEDRK